MAEHYSTPSVGINLDAVVADADGPLFQVGTIVQGTDDAGTYSAEYIYVHASGACAQYAACWVDVDGEMAEASSSETTAGRQLTIAVPQVAFADNEYGWAVISGGGSVLCISAGAAAPNVKVYLSATNGQVDDVATTNGHINNLSLRVSEGAVGSQATFHAVGRMTCTGNNG